MMHLSLSRSGISCLPIKVQKEMSDRNSIRLNMKLFMVNLLLMIFISGCTIQLQPEVFEIPESHKGCVMVVFDQCDGQDEEIEGNKRVYTIPESGILETKFSPLGRGIADITLYSMKDGRRHSEIEVWFPNSATKPDNYYMINGENGKFYEIKDGGLGRSVTFRVFAIGKPDEMDSLRTERDKFVDEYKRAYTFKDCP